LFDGRFVGFRRAAWKISPQLGAPLHTAKISNLHPKLAGVRAQQFSPSH